MTPEDISIRTYLAPGDIGYVAYMHGKLYSQECGYGSSFEGYVIAGLHEFYQQYNPAKDRIWVCEHNNQIIGFLMGVNRGELAQLRYFIIDPAYRSCGLGKKLMELFKAYLTECGYKGAYLWTTQEQETAIALYKRFGFVLTEEKPSTAFDKPLVEQRYDLNLKL